MRQEICITPSETEKHQLLRKKEFSNLNFSKNIEHLWDSVAFHDGDASPSDRICPPGISGGGPVRGAAAEVRGAEASPGRADREPPDTRAGGPSPPSPPRPFRAALSPGEVQGGPGAGGAHRPAHRRCRPVPVTACLRMSDVMPSIPPLGRNRGRQC